MLIKSNKGNNCIPPLRNTISDEHLDEMVYDNDKKCELLNKYFSLVDGNLQVRRHHLFQNSYHVSNFPA
jgi:hypothetical protein